MATIHEVYEILGDARFTNKFRQAESGWFIAYCEEVPEARTQGETLEEVRENLKDAIAFILEDYSVEELEELRDRLMSEKGELLTL